MNRLVLSVTLLGLGGCPSIGDFCYQDQDCPRGGRCSSPAGSRGVCVYSGLASDASATAERSGDGPRLDLGLEVGRDLPLADAPHDIRVEPAPLDQMAPDLKPADLKPADLKPVDSFSTDRTPDMASLPSKDAASP